MSHFTQLDKAKITDADAFIKACKELGFGEAQKNVKIKDYYGKEITVDVAVSCGKYHLAIVKNKEGKYDATADWWGVRTKNPELMGKLNIKTDSDLQDAILRHTTKHAIMNKYRALGFRATVTEDEEQNLNMKLVRF